MQLHIIFLIEITSMAQRNRLTQKMLYLRFLSDVRSLKADNLKKERIEVNCFIY